MPSSRIPFRARKVKRDPHAENLTASSSFDVGTPAKKKKVPQSGQNQEVPLFLSAETPCLQANVTTTLEVRPTSTMADRLVVVSAVKSLSGVEDVALAVEHLKGCDTRLRAVIEATKLPSFQICTSPFQSLARSIVYQQLATNAATAIYNRLLHLCRGEDFFTPQAISKLSASELRNIGISAQKASYLHDLSRSFLEGDLSDAAIMLMEDSMLMSSLTAVKGIGVWSVHMFMIFALHRPDVLPVTDLGVRKGFVKLYGLKALPSPMEMEQLAASWRPYRSLGAWYMWRLMEAKPPQVVVADTNG